MPDFSFPSWLVPRNPPWQALVAGAQVGGMIAQARYRNQALRVQVEQQAQQDVLQMRALDLRQKEMTLINQARLNSMEDREMGLRDAERLAAYMRTGELPEQLENPKSFDALNQIDIAREKTNAGRAWANTEKSFWKRFEELNGEDQAVLNDMLGRTKGTITAEIFRYAGEAWERRPAKEYAPDALQKAIDMARKAEESGDEQVATLAWERAATIARGGKDTGKVAVKPAATASGTATKSDGLATKLRQFFGIGIKPAAGREGASPTPTPANHAAIIEQANAAIRAGKDPVAVRERLKQMGVAFEEAETSEEVKAALSEMVREAIDPTPFKPE